MGLQARFARPAGKTYWANAATQLSYCCLEQADLQSPVGDQWCHETPLIPVRPASSLCQNATLVEDEQRHLPAGRIWCGRCPLR